MQGAVIDPGGDLDTVVNTVTENNVELTHILITHSHADHASAAQDLKERCNIPIIGPHKDDQYWIDRLPTDAENWGLPPARTFTPNQWLDNGDSVTVGNLNFDVYHCPGHTPGHVVFHQVDWKIAFVGDVLFKGSVGRTDFPKGDQQQLVDSIRSRLWPLGGDVTFVPGHGSTSTFADERQTNPFVGDHIIK